MEKRATAGTWRQSFSSKMTAWFKALSCHCHCAHRMAGVVGPQLPKADIFSLGLSIYEVARLQRYLCYACLTYLLDVLCLWLNTCLKYMKMSAQAAHELRRRV